MVAEDRQQYDLPGAVQERVDGALEWRVILQVTAHSETVMRLSGRVSSLGQIVYFRQCTRELVKTQPS